MGTEEHPPCPTCGGSGQINFFKGESRFLLSAEECPVCCGFGYVQEELEEPEGKSDKLDGKG
ncbi:MAG: hypothetical protein Q3M24_15900 [Candidatus Electrothrix aestuarii]|uniref:Uncharacterized protein n=1 Tax=Candidatus Electrothrix aestuarii TaxID=3062594 RepID=A0AAU8LRK9_9BACT|nr:hypothetical protein [Candidatus Electrothrix aestuarii]WPD21697.1 MAG: hypothetical protein SD837_15995 [Candidatus Electrothrix sp. GW3-3]